MIFLFVKDCNRGCNRKKLLSISAYSSKLFSKNKIPETHCFRGFLLFQRGLRDLNPRAPFETYSLSRGNNICVSTLLYEEKL